MASGDTLVVFTALNAIRFTGSSPDSVNWGPVVDLATGDDVIFGAVLPRHYGGGGVTITLVYAMTSATANNIELTTTFERNTDGTASGTDSFAGSGGTTGDVAVPGTAGLFDYATTTHTNGSDMDSLAVGETFRLKVARIIPTGTDATGDLELFSVEIRET